MDVAYDRGSPLGPSLAALLYTSGFVDDVLFTPIGPMARHVCSWAAIEHDKHNSQDYNKILLNDKNIGNTHCELWTGGEICHIQLHQNWVMAVVSVLWNDPVCLQSSYVPPNNPVRSTPLLP